MGCASLADKLSAANISHQDRIVPHLFEAYGALRHSFQHMRVLLEIFLDNVIASFLFHKYEPCNISFLDARLDLEPFVRRLRHGNKWRLA